jgi:hypothetical protein
MVRNEHNIACCPLLRFLLYLTQCISEQYLLYIYTTNITALCCLQYLTSHCIPCKSVWLQRNRRIWEPSSSHLCVNPATLYRLSWASITHQTPAAEHCPQPPPSSSLPIHNRLFLTVLTIHSILLFGDGRV